MTDHPILFSTPMVRALLAGTKTQTRRLAWREAQTGGFQRTYGDRVENRHAVPSAAARIKPGDRLWVREGWHTWHAHDDLWPSEIPRGDRIEYLADQEKVAVGKARSAIHLPRWASRLTLEVTGTRIERLQDISPADALAEGRPACRLCGDCGWINTGPDGGKQCDAPLCGISDVDWYSHLWDQINGPGSWGANPEVVVLQFDVHRYNIGAPEASHG